MRLAAVIACLLVTLCAGAQSDPLEFRLGERGMLFIASDGTQIMRFSPEGQIFVHGRLAATDAEVVEAVRDFLRGRCR